LLNFYCNGISNLIIIYSVLFEKKRKGDRVELYKNQIKHVAKIHEARQKKKKKKNQCNKWNHEPCWWNEYNAKFAILYTMHSITLFYLLIYIFIYIYMNMHGYIKIYIHIHIYGANFYFIESHAINL
jgi:hypothetical protein